jgi:DNA polymerase-3 subunit gamma/tau
MATQSLYRRYRPRRFAELKGQDHIVRALRTSVAEGREGQAYLFSGPRGTGKTSTARIMAKVLNCENPVDGEPCCECASCLSVESGTSYDVHELDAASNNGVDAMRDLIDKASLGTPGRHKVYILDEVHMLSKGAEAALLKTLEEPPPHVVFVLATTDPQKMSDTIRSRTQHLQFHLLAADTMQDHVRWVAREAGLEVTDDAIEQVIAQGAGSPRDTLSALELVANSGGAADELIALDEFVESMIDDDAGRALKMVAHAVSRGRDPRTITEELISFLRNGFLSLMAPELVQLPSQRLDALTDLAQRAGAAALVRGIEQLGEALTEMRNAPDPRVLLDVATVRLCSSHVGGDVAALESRIQRLERRVADGGAGSAVAQTPTTPTISDAAAETPALVVDPSTGRAKLGARAGARAATPATETSTPTPAQSDEAAAAADVAGESPATASEPAASEPAVSEPAEPGESPAPAPEPDAAAHAGAPLPPPEPEVAATSGGSSVSAADWESVRPKLRGMARAVFSPATLVDSDSENVTLALPNETHRQKCEQHRSVVEEALSAFAGRSVSVTLVAEGGGDSASSSGPGGSGSGSTDVAPAMTTEATSRLASTQGPITSATAPRALAHQPDPSASADVDSFGAPPLRVVGPDEAADDHATHNQNDSTATPDVVRNGRAIAEQARDEGPPPDPEAVLQTVADTLPEDDDVDLDDLVDAPPETVKTPIDRLAEAFPGSELVDDPY